MERIQRQWLGAVALTIATMGGARADVTLPKLLSDGAVLQRGTPVRVYGSAAPGEAVTITLHDQKVRASVKATADSSGHWEARLPSQKAGGPFGLTIKGNNTLEVKDILFGEVWICSGQSNMEWPLSAAYQPKAEIDASTDPELRMFTVTKAVTDTPQAEVAGGTWQSAAPTTAGGFSAVGYYFAKTLRQRLGVPIGMIHTSWGGTRIEAWTSKSVNLSLGMNPSEYAANTQVDMAARQRWERAMARWRAAGSPSLRGSDGGRAGLTAKWESVALDTVAWNSVPVPAEWDATGVDALIGVDGAVWFRTEIDLPADSVGKAMTLTLGRIDDYDTTFVNGVQVGATGAETANSWMVERKYKVPASLVRAGKNVIAVRVYDGAGGGGLTGPAESLKLTENLTVEGRAPRSWPLAGSWLYRAEHIVPANPGMAPGSNPNAASALYNAMLYPLAPYTIKGAIWYQGESNVGRHELYEKQMAAMIEDWRSLFGIPGFPFFVTQLAPFSNGGSQRIEYAQQREAQGKAVRATKNAGIAVIMDVGEENDIHPRKKGPVGERLALQALQVAYGQKLVASGPIFKEALIAIDKIRVRFDSVGKGLEVRGGMISENAVSADKLIGFQIAGEDKVFHPAEARLRNSSEVEVWSSAVRVPRYVRYAYLNFPLCNLFNKEGLPAEPFRTDK